MKKHGFLGKVVVGTLIFVVISVFIFTLLQIHYGIDPTPHYDFLRIAVPVELATSGLIEIAKSIWGDRGQKETDTQSFETGDDERKE